MIVINARRFVQKSEHPSSTKDTRFPSKFFKKFTATTTERKHTPLLREE
jgi:hypothetical protein